MQMKKQSPRLLRMIACVGVCAVISILIYVGFSHRNSFTRIANDKRYVQNTQITEESCRFTVSTDALQSVKDLEVYNGPGGKIVLSKITCERPDAMELEFQALGNITANCISIVTASAYGETGFLTSDVHIEPSEDITDTYSFQTNTFERYGNRFSLLLHFPESEDIVRDFPEVSVSFTGLIRVEFEKGDQGTVPSS